MSERDEISELLRKIEAVAWSLETRVRWIADDIEKLSARPEYVTKAEARLDDVARRLRETLRGVEQARAAYNSKPVFLEAAE